MAALSCLPAFFSSIVRSRSRSSLFNAPPLTFHRKRIMAAPCARLGGGGGGSNEGEKKKFITKEQEPEQ